MFKTLALLIFLFSSSSYARESHCSHDSTTFRCVKYERPIDGDTFAVNIPGLHPLIGRNVSIRVAGVDTPEIKRAKSKCEKKKGRIAKNLVDNLLKRAKRIDLQNVKRDKYFRIAADVKIDGASLKSYLLKNKLAVAYDGKKKQKTDWCKPIRQVSSK